MPNNDNVKGLKTLLTSALQLSEADSLDAAFAMAQMLGIIAAKMDQHVGLVPFDERWATITEVAREEYHKVKTGVRAPLSTMRL